MIARLAASSEHPRVIDVGPLPPMKGAIGMRMLVPPHERFTWRRP